MIINKKITLGTANFGMSYGINNSTGKMDLSEVNSILNYCKSIDLDLIDTAISYGDSEDTLGKFEIKRFKIISKLPKIPYNCIEVEKWIMDQVISSIDRLNIKSLYGLLLHHPEDLNGRFSKIIVKTLNNLKTSGFILKIGVSVYTPKQLLDVLSAMKVDVVQFPINIIDRRFEVSGLISKLHEKGIELHARSIFLQGLLLMKRHEIPKKFERWKNIWDNWNAELERKNLNPVASCLSYPLSLPEIDKVIIGINNLRQLKHIVKASQFKDLHNEWSFMTSNDEMLINPSNWRAL